MQCERVRDLLPEYQLGGLGWLNRRSVGRHLMVCAECAQELAALEEADALLFSAVRQEAAPDLWPRIESRLPERPVTRPSRLRYAWAPAGAVVVAAAVWLLWPRTDVSPPSVVEAGFEVGYERQHALLGWNDPLADRVYLGVAGLESSDDVAQ